MQMKVDRLFGESTKSLSHCAQSMENAEAAIGFLKKLTPHAVGAAKAESEELSAIPDSLALPPYYTIFPPCMHLVPLYGYVLPL